MTNLSIKPFSKIDLNDVFFDSLKDDYALFAEWFNRKSLTNESTYVHYINHRIVGFLYLKIENQAIADISMPLPHKKHLKVGTFKIEAHGTKLGERFIKKIFDNALAQGVDDIYVTIFPKHVNLIALLIKYGFSEWGTKTSTDGTETVFVKQMHGSSDNGLTDFPFFSISNRQIYLLAIYPQYHSRFLPDSILNNEHLEIVNDVSHTNSIHKVYISGIGSTQRLRPGDVVLIYRTSDGKGPAHFRSVATSICVVEEVRKISTFPTISDFVSYAKPYSIFTTEELRIYYTRRTRRYIIRFTYNAAMTKRITRGRLIHDVGITTDRRWDFMPITEAQLRQVAALGEVNESIIVD